MVLEVRYNYCSEISHKEIFSKYTNVCLLLTLPYFVNSLIAAFLLTWSLISLDEKLCWTEEKGKKR